MSNSARDPLTSPGPMYTHISGRTPQLETIGRLLKVTVKPFLWTWSKTWFLPWPTGLVDHVGRVLARDADVETAAVQLPNCSAQMYSPKNLDSDRLVLYFHGGAFLVGGNHLHRQMISRFSTELATRVLAVGYRKMPRHSLMAAIDDCLDAYRYALSQGSSPDRVVFMGDSAGGYLALVAAMQTKSAGLPMPGAIVAMSPLTDWNHTTKVEAVTAGECAVFPRSAVAAFARAVRRYGDGSVELISPAQSELTGLPPTLIQAGRREMLYPDAVAVAERLAQHEVACELQTWDTNVHVFQAAAGIAPEAAHAVRSTVAFIDRIVHRKQQREAS
ncbi:MAG: alpha/beta hydrolase [Nocardiaceae bacterium]|nr:alpha/beta hydrolase [Nocardiaceae bacterium]